MGNLLNLLTCNSIPENALQRRSSGRSSRARFTRRNFDMFIDFYNAQPVTTNERQIYAQVSHDFSSSSRSMLFQLENYKAGEEVRNALASPDNFKLQKLAFDLVQERIRTLERLYDFSAKVNLSILSIIGALTDQPEGLYDSDEIVKLNLENMQSLVKQLAQILHFTLRFDERKIANTSLQHDLSFYRRMLTKFKQSTQFSNEEVQEVLASSEFISMSKITKMSFFFGEATPMLKNISKELQKYIEENKLQQSKVQTVLIIIVAVCNVMLSKVDYLEKLKYERVRHSHDTGLEGAGLDTSVTNSGAGSNNNDTKRPNSPRMVDDDEEKSLYYVLRILVASVVVYDHLNQGGAFCRKSGIDVKRSIKIINTLATIPDQRETLLNTLRFSSVHLRDDGVPGDITTLLAVN